MMVAKVSKENTLADGLIERTSSMLNEIDSEPCIMMKKVIDRGKRSKTRDKFSKDKSRAKGSPSFT